MQLTGQRIIAADKEKVWLALNDPDILRASIPGCEALEKLADDRFTATVSMKVGPVKAKMEGDVSLSDIDASNGYTISGKGKGAAGMASGSAKVALSDEANGTKLSYVVDAKVGGKLAEVGARFIDSTAQKMADQFFDSFADQVTGAAPSAAAASEDASPRENGGNKTLLFVVVAAIAAAAAIYALI